MDNITIICAVAADFVGPGGLKFSVTRKDLNLVLSAPAWIQNTRMFSLLAADGSLKFVTPSNRIQAENNPTVGLAADGRAVRTEPEPEVQKPVRGRKPKAEPEAPAVESAPQSEV